MNECGAKRCDLEWVAVADGVALLNRLKLEGEATRADVVLGLDTSLVADAKAMLGMQPKSQSIPTSAKLGMGAAGVGGLLIGRNLTGPKPYPYQQQ